MIFVILFVILIKSNSNQSSETDEALNIKKVSDEDLKMQMRIAKEIENFLNYNGEIQDDI